jgi:hypothetical protein
LLVNSTAVTNALTAINTTLNAISTALTTSHVFGGTFTVAINVASTVVSNPSVVSNSRIAFSPAKSSAGLAMVNAFPYVSTITPGVSFLFQYNVGSSIAGGDTYSYVGYNS